MKSILSSSNKIHQINQINHFTVIYFMHKKYQDIPSQIISRYGSKFLIKRQLIESKFQWIMKYMANKKEQSQDNGQNIIRKKHSEPFHNRSKGKYFQDRVNTSVLSKQLKKERKKTQYQNDKQNGLYSKIYEIITKSQNNDCQSRIFIEKSQLNNRSINIHKGSLKKNLASLNSRSISRKNTLKPAHLNVNKHIIQNNLHHYKSMAEQDGDELSPWKYSKLASLDIGEDQAAFKCY